MTVRAAVVRHGIPVLVALALSAEAPLAQQAPATRRRSAWSAFSSARGAASLTSCSRASAIVGDSPWPFGLAEANGIAVPLENRVPPRPLTHDLFLTLFGRLRVTVTKVVITDLRDDIYSPPSTSMPAARRCSSTAPLGRHRAGHPRQGARLRRGSRLRKSERLLPPPTSPPGQRNLARWLPTRQAAPALSPPSSIPRASSGPSSGGSKTSSPSSERSSAI